MVVNKETGKDISRFPSLIKDDKEKYMAFRIHLVAVIKCRFKSRAVRINISLAVKKSYFFIPLFYIRFCT